MSEHEHEPITVEETTYCAVHPDRETSLQCNRCGRYMCVECAVHTPVGYRCRAGEYDPPGNNKSVLVTEDHQAHGDDTHGFLSIIGAVAQG